MATKESEDKEATVSTKLPKAGARKSSKRTPAATKKVAVKKRSAGALQVDEVHGYVIVSENGVPNLTPTELSLLGTFLDLLKSLGVISACEKPGG